MARRLASACSTDFGKFSEDVIVGRFGDVSAPLISLLANRSTNSPIGAPHFAEPVPKHSSADQRTIPVFARSATILEGDRALLSR
jgi:hypothetical protein